MSQMERIPPHSDEAEKSVLGAALLDREVLPELEAVLTPADFYSEMHKEIFDAILTLSRKNEPVDVLTVSEELKKRKTLEMVGGRAYIAELSTVVPTTANAVQYAEIVSQKAILRKLITAAGNTMENAYREQMEPGEVLEDAERSIFAISQGKQSRGFDPLKDILMDNVRILDELSQNKGGLTGLTTGFRDLDKMTAGLQKSDLIILAARPAMGKTSFALSVMHQAATKGKANVLIFNLEMSKQQLGQKFLSMESRVDMAKLKVGDLSREDWDSIFVAVDRLAEAGIYIDDTPGVSISEIRSKARRLKAEKGLGLIVVDYLQLMTLGGKVESRQQEITALSRQFKQLARELDVPIILLSQLSRSPDQRPDHRPVLSDLRESGAIEQDADVVMFLYRDGYYNKDSEDANNCEVIIAKQRSGPTGTVNVTWLDKLTRFVDAARTN
ncbi:MAG: replicative DNA helicase [Clostridiales bacterium]|nr:replicative DNA helicase [Clostridiales bacterium]